MLHYILALGTWIPESVYSTQMFPLSHSGVRDRLYLHLFTLSTSLVPSSCSSSSTSSSSLSSPGLNQQTTIPSFLTFSRGTAGYLWLLAAAFRNLRFINVRLLSLTSNVTFTQHYFFFSLCFSPQIFLNYKFGVVFIIIKMSYCTLLDFLLFLNRVGCFNCLLLDGTKGWRSESRTDTTVLS